MHSRFLKGQNQFFGYLDFECFENQEKQILQRSKPSDPSIRFSCQNKSFLHIVRFLRFLLHQSDCYCNSCQLPLQSMFQMQQKKKYRFHQVHLKLYTYQIRKFLHLNP